MKLIITGNGRVGAATTRALARFGERPRLLVRDESRARERFGDVAEIMTGDISDIESVRRALSGVESVMLCTPVDPQMTTWHNAIVDAIAEAGATLVRVAGLATFPGSYVDSGRWHSEAESYAASTGVTATYLHPIFFHQNLGFQLQGAAKTGVLKSAVTDFPVAMIDAEDIGEVAARVMQNPEPGRTLRLTAGSYTYDDVAALMSEVLDKEIRFAPQTIEELQSSLRASGQPDWHIDVLLQFNRAFNEGIGAEVTGDAERVLGRPPIPLRDYLASAVSMTAEGRNPFPS